MKENKKLLGIVKLSSKLLHMGDSYASHYVMWSGPLQALTASIYLTYERKEEESLVKNKEF